MINAAFNVGAIAGAKRARESSGDSYYFGNYTPEPKPKVMGCITIESDPLMSVKPSMVVDGAEVKFRSVIAVNKLIDKLIRLRDDMYKKEAGVKHNFQLGDYVYRTMKVPKINWIPFYKNNPPDDLRIGEEYLILLREDNYNDGATWTYHMDYATAYGDYLDNFWDTTNDWNEGQRIEVLAYAEFPGYLKETDLVEV